MGKQEAPIILAGSVRGTGNFLPVVGGGSFGKSALSLRAILQGLTGLLFRALPC